MSSPHSPINVQFTSGTTGRPKAAALTHYGIVNNARSIQFVGNQHCQEGDVMMSDEDTVIINNLPLYHVFSFTAGGVLGAVSKGEGINTLLLQLDF